MLIGIYWQALSNCFVWRFFRIGTRDFNEFVCVIVELSTHFENTNGKHIV